MTNNERCGSLAPLWDREWGHITYTPTACHIHSWQDREACGGSHSPPKVEQEACQALASRSGYRQSLPISTHAVRNSNAPRVQVPDPGRNALDEARPWVPPCELRSHSRTVRIILPRECAAGASTERTMYLQEAPANAAKTRRPSKKHPTCYTRSLLPGHGFTRVSEYSSPPISGVRNRSRGELERRIRARGSPLRRCLRCTRVNSHRSPARGNCAVLS